MTGRTISVGVDEAGYAPKLGPLVVTATSVERPAFSRAPAEPDACWARPFLASCRAESADLYAMLASAVAPSQASCRASARSDDARPPGPLLVADSKVVYRPGGGLAGLERGVISFLRAADVPCDALATDLGLIAAVSHPPPDLDGLPWYGGAPEPLPVEADADDIRLASGALARALSRAGCGRPAIRSKVITARELNRAVAGGLNKAELLVDVVAGLLAAACPVSNAPADATGLPGFSILIDRLGGRKDYSGLLAKAFPGAEVREESVSPTESRYTVGSGRVVRTPAAGRVKPELARRRRGPDRPGVRVTFACRAESRCMTVALSSMVSKYVRELMMRRLNRYFAERAPGLKPTAGYPVDAARFLEDTRDLRRRSGIRGDLLVRAR